MFDLEGLCPSLMCKIQASSWNAVVQYHGDILNVGRGCKVFYVSRLPFLPATFSAYVAEGRVSVEIYEVAFPVLRSASYYAVIAEAKAPCVRAGVDFMKFISKFRIR